MAGKENPDLFSQHSSNEGSLPLDFDKNAGAGDSSKKEPEKKMGASESSSIKSHPRIEKVEPQRRPTHHVPPPYKKTVQEAASLESKSDVETKSAAAVQDKPMEKPEVEPVKDKEEGKPAVAAVQTPVSESIPIPAQPEVPVQSQKPTVVSAPVASPVVPVSVPAVQAARSLDAAQVEKSPESEPVPKHAKHLKAPHAANIAVNEKQVEPVIQATSDPKSEVPDIKQQEMKASNVPKTPSPVNIKKEVTTPASPVSHERKLSAEQKRPKTEIQKPAKKTGAIEKFSTDNATAGQLLQEGRVRTGLSIEQVSISTKIKKTFIESMERDDFENLPASVYVNAYTRALCPLYNIDEKLVFSLLNKVKGKSFAFTVPEEVIHQLEKGKQVNIVQENKVKRIFLIGLAACFTVVACILIAYYSMHVKGKHSSSTTALKPVLIPELPVQTGVVAGTSAKAIGEEMEKKLMAPYVFTMTSLPLAER
jgi:ribosome-binding protein aMBF1 (putative translation factor)